MSRKLSILLLIPVVLMLYNNIANRHQHTLDNGLTVTHAHPLDNCCNGDGPCDCHHHTEKELLYFALLSDTPEIIFFNVLSIEPDLNTGTSNSFYSSPFIKAGDCLSLPLLRAPPAKNS